MASTSNNPHPFFSWFIKNKEYLAMLFIAIAVPTITFYLYWQKFSGPVSNNHTRWAEFGTISGGILGALFAFLAFLVLLRTLDVNKTELQETRAVLSKQSTDSTFFNMMSLYNEVLNEISIDKLVVSISGQNTKVITSRDAFLELHSKFSKQYLLKTMRGDYPELNSELSKIRKAYDDFHQRFGQKVGHYYRLLYNILKFIDRSSLEEQDKRTYVNILRSQLSQYEIALLFFSCNSSLGKEKFLPLALKYDLFKHIDYEILADYIPIAEEGFKLERGKTLYEEVMKEIAAEND